MEKNLDIVPANRQAGDQSFKEMPTETIEILDESGKMASQQASNINQEKYDDDVDYKHNDNGQAILPGCGETNSAIRLKEKTTAYNQYKISFDKLLENTNNWHFYVLHSLIYFIEAIKWLQAENDGFGKITFINNHQSVLKTDKISIIGFFADKKEEETASKKYLFYQERFKKELSAEEITSLSKRKADDLFKITDYIEQLVKNNSQKVVSLINIINKFLEALIWLHSNSDKARTVYYSRAKQEILQTEKFIIKAKYSNILDSISDDDNQIGEDIRTKNFYKKRIKQ